MNQSGVDHDEPACKGALLVFKSSLPMPFNMSKEIRVIMLNESVHEQLESDDAAAEKHLEKETV